MTAIQTIDGVPRELLARLCNFHATGWEDIEPEIKELRALLAAPAVKPHPFGYWLTPKTCAGLAMFQRELIEDPVLTKSVVEYFHIKPLYDTPATQSQGETPDDDKSHPRFIAGYTAGLRDYKLGQPQGEPVGFRYRANNEPWVWMDESPFADGRHHYKQGYEELEPLYAEQPAPVAVVLPERKHVPDFTLHPMLHKEYTGWNACLDELRRLNP